MMGKGTKNSLLKTFPKKLQKLVKQIVWQENYNEEYLLVSMLSAAASAAGNSARICIKGEWTTCASLYMILVGNPGQGKTPPLDFAYAPIRKRDEDLRQQYLATIEKKSSNKKNSSPSTVLSLSRTIVSDFTPEALLLAHDANPRGISIYVDEIMGMFNSVNQYCKGQLIEQLLTAYSGNPLDVMRVSMERPIHIGHPCINIAGTTQTARIKELFYKGFQQNGLLDRFLLSYPVDTTISLWNRKGGRKKEVSVMRQWEDIMEKILQLPFPPKEPCSQILHFSAAARKEYFDWHDNGVRILSESNIPEREQGRMMKAHLHVARIALCIQILKWACGEGKLDAIDVESVRSAIRISNYFDDCYQRISVYVKHQSVSPHLKMFIKKLNKQFCTSEAVSHGEDMGMGRRNVMYTLSKLQRLGFITQVQHGKYEKICDLDGS